MLIIKTSIIKVSNKKTLMIRNIRCYKTSNNKTLKLQNVKYY